jgi:hypothetical protein
MAPTATAEIASRFMDVENLVMISLVVGVELCVAKKPLRKIPANWARGRIRSCI